MIPLNAGKGHDDDEQASEDSPLLSYGFKKPNPPTTFAE